MWKPTHYSLQDGSVVRLVDDDTEWFTVENEDGEQFAVKGNEWAPIVRDYTSVAWASHVNLTLEAAAAELWERMRILDQLAADMDEDGKDMERGPHAPPIRDVASTLRLAAAKLTDEASRWRIATDNRARNQDRSSINEA